MKPLFLIPVLWLGMTGLLAQPVEPDFESRAREERARIAAERAQLKGGLFEQERACYQRFAVNDCLRKARRQQREALTLLRHQEVMLNDEERQRKAAARLHDESPETGDPASPAVK